MNPIFSRRTGTARAPLSLAALSLAALYGIAGCAAPSPAGPPAPAASVPATAVRAPVAPAPSSPQDAAGPDGNARPVLFNDPPAAPDTPLCGQQAREVNALGTTLQGPRMAASGICATFACYDPLTATYVGADGYRHVCR